ncbi:MAG TPA: T9SS type A sorting domain-containing protein [Bacteroidales bacterium]|nr:T9SS type A sorting domain-containing protein [Bacteroidales bacterium]
MLFVLLAGLSSGAFAQPEIYSFAPDSGSVGTLVTINGTGLSDPISFTIGGTDAIVISNDGSTLVGMVMPGANTGNISITTGGGSTNSEGNFSITPSLSPTMQQGSKLVGTVASENQFQGESVSISADGNTAIVGGPCDNDYKGAAWIYTRNNRTWTQQGDKLVGTNSIGYSYQGKSVSLSADGNTAIVGGNNDNNGVGAAWIYTRSGGTWSQQGSKLVGNDPGGTFISQGSSVSLSADGNTAIVGGIGDDDLKGAAWIYTRSGGTWTQQGKKLVGNDSDGTFIFQGSSVSLSADGNTAIVGGNIDNNNVGAAWIYTRSGGTWSQQGSKLVGNDYVEYPNQGTSVSLSADGNTAIVGGNNDNNGVGAAWIYTRSGVTWSQHGNKLVWNDSDGTSTYQGYSVSLSADGNTAIVGGYGDDDLKGAAWIYTLSGGAWTQQGSKLVDNDCPGSHQGWSVSLSADGSTALVGGPYDDDQIGAAWVYIPTPPPPTVSSFTPESGSIGTLVTISGTELYDPVAFTIGGTDALIISNDGSTLVGMVMPGANSGNISITTGGGTVYSDGNFTVTPTLFPAVQQGNKLVGTGSSGTLQQGYAVSVSADGNTAIVGEPYDNYQIGAAWIYTRSSGSWAQQQKIAGTGYTGTSYIYQGSSVSLSADGNTAIIGGYGDNNNTGAVWIFTRSNGTWSQQGNKLVGTEAAVNQYQGWSVSLSADGNTAIIGGSGYSDNKGAAWIFSRSGGTWTEQSKLVDDDFLGTPWRGTSVSLSADGNTAIVGGNNDNSGVGAAWIWTRSGETWTKQSKLVAEDHIGASKQGQSVSLSADGNTVIVGGHNDNSAIGAAWIWTRIGETWTEQSKLVAEDHSGASNQGFSVFLSADGNTALMGGRYDDSNKGAAWIWTRSGETWTKQTKLVDNDCPGSHQGWSVSLSADGSTALVGGPYDDDQIGAAWVYIPTPPPTVSSFTPASGSAGTLVTINGAYLGNPTAFTIGGNAAIVISNDGSTLVGMVMPGATTGIISISTDRGTVNSAGNFTVTSSLPPTAQQGSKLVGTGGVAGIQRQGMSVSLSADGNTAIVGGYGDNDYIGAAWIYTRNNGTWTQQGNKLVANDFVGKAQQGVSVSLSADGNTAIVGGNGDNSNIGAAWIYTRTGSTWSQQGKKLEGNDDIGASSHGNSVSLSADGNTAIVGGFRDNSNIGAAWIYTRTGSTWTQQGSKLVGTNSIGYSYQGYSVSISADGNTAIIGGNGDNSNIGAAWIFTRSGSIWTQQGNKLIGTDYIGENNIYQGQSVSLSADGSTAIVGGRADKVAIGAAWVYTRTGNTWTQQGNKLVGTGYSGSSPRQGYSVGLSADGNTAIIGGYGDDSSIGAAWIFTRSSGIWSQQGDKLVGTVAAENQYQGCSVSLSTDGNTAIVGGYGDNNGKGAAWVFAPLPAPLATGATNILTDGFTANWNASTDATGYYIDVASDEGFTTLINNSGSGNEDVGDVLTITATGLTAGTAYYYRLRAYKGDVTSTSSNVITVTTLQTQTITFGALDTKTYGDAPFTLSATGGGSGNSVTFSSSDETIATCTGTNGETVTILKAGSCSIYANQAGNSAYAPAPQAEQTLTVNKADPVITWSDPDDIEEGTALSTVQLNATADAPGTFTYTPPAGTILSAGVDQSLYVLFVPDDLVNYNNADKTVHITVTVITDVEHVSESIVTLYPNPAKGIITISGLAEITDRQIVRLSVSDNSGKILIQKNLERKISSEIIDISSLADGIYLIILQTDKEKIVKRFVKQ